MALRLTRYRLASASAPQLSLNDRPGHLSGCQINYSHQMDVILLRIYQHQVAISCQAVLLGHEDLRSAVEEQNRTFEASPRLWYGVQNLIVGAGNLSKTLWGTGRTTTDAEARQARRKSLRDSLGISDDSPLRRIKIRNDYEHLDERLEKWWDKSTHHNFVAALVGPRGSVGGDAIDEDQDVLRWLDPVSGDVIFWGNELHIPTVVDEVQRLLPIAEREAAKPHWEQAG